MIHYPTFLELSLEELTKYVKDLKHLEASFIANFNLPIYLIYGTLLGAIRDKDFILHDTDVDIAYLSNYHKSEDVLNERNHLIDNLETFKLLRHRETIGIKIKYNNNDFDLWTSWIDENNNYNVLPFSPLGSKDLVQPLQDYIFKGEKFLIPNQSIILLEKIYKDWQTPIKHNYLKQHARSTLLKKE